MRLLLLAGTALAALAGGTALARESTGDPVIDRLNALEARVKPLEARNAKLEQQAVATQSRVEAAEKREWKRVRFNGTNTPLDPAGTRTAGDAFGTRLHVDF